MRKRIVITTIGTVGDVLPYVALAAELKARGHSVLLTAPEDFEELVTSHGVEFASLGCSIRSYLRQSRFEKAMSQSLLLNAPFLMLQAKKIFEEAGFRFWKAAQGAELIIMQMNASYAIDAAEALQIPVIMSAPNPLTATSEYPFCAYNGPKIGNLFKDFLNRLTYFPLDFQQWCYNPSRNIMRKKFLGLEKLKNGRFLKTNGGEDILILYAYSEKMIPRPKDWPSTAVVTGYWTLEAHQKWQPSPELIEFLAAGEKPVYISFGSMPFGTVRNTRILKEALSQWGGRAIVSQGWGGINTDDLPPSVFAIGYAPHDQVFKYVKAVIHHGGAGTTLAGLSLGVPTWVVAQAVDQPFWGRRVEELGCGPRHIHLSNLAAENLVTALKELTTNLNYAHNAEKVAFALNSESGKTVAAQVIEDYLEKLSNQKKSA